MNGLRTYWDSLSTRERLIVGLGGVVTVLVLGYVLLWEPWQRRLDQLRAQVPAQIETLAWMRVEAARVAPLRNRRAPTPSPTTPVLTVIEQSARQAKLRDAIRRIQPGAEDEVKVWLSNVPFDPWLRWLEILKRQGIEVVAANVNRAPGNKVNIRVTFQRV